MEYHYECSNYKRHHKVDLRVNSQASKMDRPTLENRS